MSKQKIWDLIEAYRTSGGREEHHARKEILDAALDKALAQRTWVGLTDEEIEQMGLSNYIKVVRETEAKLKEKNT